MTTGSRTLLAGGYRNQVWKVRTSTGFVIEKQYAEDPGSPNPMFPNLPDHEALAMAHLAGSGCAPELLDHHPGNDHEGARVVYRYVSGTPWRSGVADVAALLSTVHGAGVPSGIRRLHRSATEALAHADSMVADVPVRRDRDRMTASRPRAMVHRPVRTPVLVHTDCGPGNIVRGRNGPVLIDWQCPGAGDPVEDIACFLSPAMMILYAATPHRPAARATFLAAYPDGAVVERYGRDGPAWHYRIAAYCVWRARRMARTQPEIARRYRDALAAELALLDGWPA